MNRKITALELHEDQWFRYRDIRLAALESDGHAFGGNLDSERLFSEDDWRSKARQYVAIVVNLDDADIAMMTVENLDGDFGATCWVGSCWVSPKYRKMGALRALFDYLDSMALERNWITQGLGVWVDNEIAITAYEKLGFEKKGEKQESSRKPGIYYQRMIRETSSN
jgi:RimJ/RimL family protein N-acetyltransferase